jgi:hypothetical protein
MEPVWDYIASNSWLRVSLFFIFTFMITVVWWFRPFRTPLYNRILSAVLSLGSAAVIFYMSFAHIGYAVHFDGALSNGEQLCLTESHSHAAGRSSTTRHRLYVLDVKTGKRIYRMALSTGQMLMVRKKGVVFFEGVKAIEYNLQNGDCTNEWSKEKGFEKFTELKSGIQDLNRHWLWWKSINSAYLTLTANDGNKYCYDLVTDSLHKKEYLRNLPEILKYSWDEDGVYFKNEKYSDEVAYRFEYGSGERRKLYKSKYPEENIFYPYDFLRPKVIALFENEQFFVIKHLESLDEKNTIFTAINFDLTKKWEVKQNEMDVTDGYNDNPEFGTWHQVNNNLVVTFGGFVVYLAGSTGKPIWKVRL